MIKVKTKDDKYIGLIEVPKLAFYFDWIEGKNGNIYIYWETEDGRIGGIKTNFQKWNDFEILNKLSKLDKELEEFVDKILTSTIGIDYWESYDRYYNSYKTPKQSFISLIKSQRPEFQEDKEWLVIKLL